MPVGNTDASLSVGARLALGFGLIALIAVAVTVASHRVIRSLDDGLAEIVGKRYPRTELVRAVIDEMAAISSASRDVLLVERGEPMLRELARIEQGRARIGALMEQLDAQFKSGGEQVPAVYGAVHAASSPYLIGLIKFSRTVQSANAGEARAFLNGPLRIALHEYSQALYSLKEYDGERMRTRQRETSDASGSARRLILLLLAAALVAAGLVAALCTRALTRPILQAVSAASSISSGDLAVESAVGRRDETGRLLLALNEMTRSLSRIVGRVRTVARSVEVASHQIGGASADLSARADEQAAGFRHMADSMRELEGMVDGIAQSSGRADSLAKKVHEVARCGGQTMHDALATMREARASTSKIGEIIGLIDGLAFQTNILALNAAVESARAGEHGRGFAVVAAEVRALAQRSAAAAKDVRGLISGSMSKIEVANELLGTAGASVGEVGSVAQEMSQLIEEVSLAAQAHTAAVSRLTRSMAQMNAITQHNAAAARQTDGAARALHEQSAELADSISVFKLAADPERS